MEMLGTPVPGYFFSMRMEGVSLLRPPAPGLLGLADLTVCCLGTRQEAVGLTQKDFTMES